MSNDPRRRRLFLPDDSLAERNVPGLRLPAGSWFRVHAAAFGPVHFSLNAGHRFSHAACPQPLLYLGAEVETCLFERFAGVLYQENLSISYALWRGSKITAIEVPQLPVCDLTCDRTLTALRVDLGSLMHNDLAVPQAWGLAIQRHPAAFRGIRFKSRFNGKPCLALFGGEHNAKGLAVGETRDLVESEAAANWLHKHQVRLY